MNKSAINTATQTNSAGTPNTTATWSSCGATTLMETNEVGDIIEIIYREDSLISENRISLASKVYKIIFRCIEGKWNKSEPIYGEIISARDEYFKF